MRSSVGFTLGVNVENLVLTGDAAIDGNDNGLDNTLIGNAANNQLSAGAGNDTLIGAAGSDTLIDSAGDNVFIGGSGNDTLQGGSGADVFAFNRGDGIDTVLSAGGGADTVSLGGGLDGAGLTFAKSGNDLALGVGAGEQIVLKDWYAASAQRSIANLQLVGPSAVDQYDFAGLVARFDQARVADPSLTSWSLGNALNDLRTAGAAPVTVGGDVVHGETPVMGGGPRLAAAAAATMAAEYAPQSVTRGSDDDVNLRIERVLGHWLEARRAGPGIRLGHYDQVLRGELDPGDGIGADDEPKASYAARWTRLRSALDGHMAAHGGVFAADVGAPWWSSDGFAFAGDDRCNRTPRPGERVPPAGVPLPMFSGLQDGFDRL